MSFSIEGKTAIITGSANGIGLAVARHFVDVGAKVMMADADEEKLRAEMDAIKGAETHVKTFSGDLKQKLAMANLVAATVDEFDRVDILINADRVVKESNCMTAKQDCFEDILQKNVVANFRLTQKVVARMLKQNEESTGDDPSGTIVNLTSIVAERAYPELMSYSVSCAAINQMTRTMALSLAEYKIRVNAIAIGSVMSVSMQAALREDKTLRKTVVDATPLGRIAEAEEVAGAAQFLCSGASGFMTGQILTIDGGRLLQDPISLPVH